MDAVTSTPAPVNEPVRHYAPGSAERASLEQRLLELQKQSVELGVTIGGEQRAGRGPEFTVVQPHNIKHVLATGREGSGDDTRDAIAAAAQASRSWQALSFDDRAAVFLKAADLLTGPWRDTLNAATMLGQSQDRLPGRDRRRLRAHRLLAVQRPLRPADPRRAADGELGRRRGTASTTARSRVSSTRSRRSTSPRSPATCRPRPR